MTGKRFYVDKSENQDTIFDDEGIDDYYHLGNDTRDVNALCRLLNELHEENQSSKEFIEQLQEELVLFKNAGADMGIDLNNQITALKKENEQLKQIIYEDESQIIGEWSSHIQEDMKKLNKAYESDDINDLIRFCKGS